MKGREGKEKRGRRRNVEDDSCVEKRADKMKKTIDYMREDRQGWRRRGRKRKSGQLREERCVKGKGGRNEEKRGILEERQA